MRNIARSRFPERLQNCDPTICLTSGTATEGNLAKRPGEPGTYHTALSFDAHAEIVAALRHPPPRTDTSIFSVLRPAGAGNERLGYW